MTPAEAYALGKIAEEHPALIPLIACAYLMIPLFALLLNWLINK